MKCLIILNGGCDELVFLKKLSLNYNYIICADGGYKHAQKCGIAPDIVLGDFDSCEKPENVGILQYPVEKDLTDCEIAINHAISKGYKSITLTCALGGRVDHQLANMMLCLSYSDRADVMIKESDCEVLSLIGERNLSDYQGKTFSIIPFSPCKISIKGTYYPLSDKIINLGETLTVSNVVTDKNSSVLTEYGKALLVINKNI